ncbi:hypothetical protein NA065_004558 [Salmonella enterica]|uniref:hypothetical protein n=1 Tax=Klebsiella pneumoniae TaxID=573 RepID=UPI0025560AD0|nr:hypothetical protein [Klebsiella pneumoniae]EJG9149358.1 hypothetical protein [Salmonella enterica]EMA7000416.1 hypothetical protein [Shigella sonnei]MDK9893948.1 hypothetical protein [Klebsiella pneumoniae]HBU7281306.1 hypothetical protein [Klebsiella pneumoniae]
MKSVLSSFCYFMAVVALSAAYQVSNNVSDKTESGLLNYLLSLPTAPTLVFCGAVFILIATYLLPNNEGKKKVEPRYPKYRPSYTPHEIQVLEKELSRLKETYSRLEAADDLTVLEFKKNNPRVSSELHIRELIKFQADRLKHEIAYKESNLKSAKKRVRK